MTEQRRHYSFSQLNMLLRCGEQYRRRYVEGERLAPSGNLVRGKCAHKTAEVNYAHKIETQSEFGMKDLPVEQMVDLFVDEWERAKYEIALTEEELANRSPAVALGEFKDSGVRLVGKYHQEVSPTVQPASVEEKFVVQFEEDVPDLVGIMDVVDIKDTIVESKFVGKTPNAFDIQTDVQLTTYDVGFRVTRKRSPKELRKISTVDLKREPKVVVQTAPPRDDETVWRFLHRLKKAHEAINAGNFLPAPNGAWWCSSKFCGYFATCRVRP